MFGLAVLVVGVIYLIVLLTATIGAYFWAARRGLSRAKRWLAAAGGFLAIYLPVFWDHIPTVVANHYYCSTQAGFTVYKTVEKWVAENPGVAQKFTRKEMSDSMQLPDGERQFLNERFVWDTHRNLMIPFLSTKKFERVIMDTQTGEILARHVSFGSGPGGRDWRELKFWLADSCMPQSEEFGFFEINIEKLGVQR